MLCLQPIYLRENGLSVPCGACPKCREKKSKDWQFRLYQEYRHSHTAKFLTMTYEDENLPTWTDKETGEIKSNLKIKDLQNFFKRLRKEQYQFYNLEDQKSKIIHKKPRKRYQIRYYAVGEYGEKTDRAHYHIMLFNLEPEIQHKIETIWKQGSVHSGTCNAKTIAYTLKYVLKTPTKRTKLSSRNHERQSEFSLSSRRPAIGHQYNTVKMAKYHKKNLNTTVKNINGDNQALPKYYHDKFFNIREKMQLLQKTIELVDKVQIQKDIKEMQKLGIPESLYHQRVKDYLRKVEKRKNNKKNKL